MSSNTKNTSGQKAKSLSYAVKATKGSKASKRLEVRAYIRSEAAAVRKLGKEVEDVVKKETKRRGVFGITTSTG